MAGYSDAMICGMDRLLKSFLAGIFAVLLWGTAEAAKEPSGVSPEGRVKVTYWEKWTGFEGAGIRAIVDEFKPD